jgi:hypothetical protein
MSTAARLEANRANAQHSTGPVTDSGKERASLNSLRHGLTSKTVVLPGEDPEKFERLRASVHEHYRPKTEIERELAERIAAGQWKIQRAHRVEAAFYNSVIEASPDTDPDAAIAAMFLDKNEMARMRLFLRYLAAAQRAYDLAVAEMRKVQKERRTHEEQLAIFESRPNGFVSQPGAKTAAAGSEIAACAPAAFASPDKPATMIMFRP